MRYLITIAAMALLPCAWLAIQRAWGRTFADVAGPGDDVLALRRACDDCSCRGSDRCRRDGR